MTMIRDIFGTAGYVVEAVGAITIIGGDTSP